MHRLNNQFLFFYKQLQNIFIICLVSVLIPQFAKAACGKLVVVKGDVQIENSKTKKSSKAQVNSEVCSGDGITAGKDSRAKVEMVDGNEINISPDTKIILESYEFNPEQQKKKVTLNVMFGKVRANVKQKYDEPDSSGTAQNTFQVKTKTAVAGVRGTDFLTSYSPQTQKSEVVTFSGKVDVGQPGPNGQMMNPVSVGAGQKTLAAPNQAPSAPVNVPASELKQLNSSSKADGPASPSSNGPSASNKSDKDDSKEDKKDSKSDKQQGDKGDKSGDKQGDKQGEKQGDKNSSEKQDSRQSDKQDSKSSAKSEAGSSDSGKSKSDASPNSTTSGKGPGGASGSSASANSSGPGGPNFGERSPASTDNTGPKSGPMPGMGGGEFGGARPGGMGSMIDSTDLGGAAGAKVPDFSKSPLANVPDFTAITPIANILPPVVNPCTAGSACSGAVQGGSSKVTITINVK